MAIMRCKQTHKLARYLIQQCTKSIQMLVFTFDLIDIVNDLIETARRGIAVEVFADRRSSLGTATRDQYIRIKSLHDAGITVQLATGVDIQEEYNRIGRRVRPGTGILHAKCLLMDEKYLIAGSANWTTSSRNNTELSLLLKMYGHGISGWQSTLDSLRDRSEVFGEAHVLEVNTRRSPSLNRSQTT